MRTPLLLLAASSLALAACQTPREACISSGERQLRTIELLIGETQGNLSRGYGIETEQRVEVDRDICRVQLEDGSERSFFCEDTDVVEVERPVALDLDAERRKLEDLLAQRDTLQAQQAARIQACAAAYPE